MTEKNNLINLNAQNHKEEKTTNETNDHLKRTKKKEKQDSKSFRLISKISPQKRKGRYNVFINEEFAFGVDEETLIRFELKKGLHITPEFQKKIEDEESFSKAYQKTLNYLSYSLRTEKQIKDYLVKNEFEHYTDRIIDKLKSSRLLDDLIYAQSYIRTMANVNQKGPQNIIQDLKLKGVSEKDIFDALEEYSEDQQFKNAIDLAEKKWSKTKKRSEFESIQKVKQYLVNKGYSFEMAERAMNEIDTEKDEEEEYHSLIKQADKARKRYARKYEGYELSQRLRAFLYGKGYSNELISRYMDEREFD